MTDYPYEGQLVADPVTFQRATNAQITVYDGNDTTNSTPLALKGTSGLPLPNPMTSSSDAFTNPFYAPSQEIKLVGAGLTVFVSSAKGMRDAAAASAAAAQSANNSAAAAAVAAAEAAVAPTDAAVDAGIVRAGAVPKWKANTAYALGQQIVAPDGSVLSALAAFTSGASFNAANWSPSLSATYARPLANTFVMAGDSITVAGQAHGGRTFWAHAENFTHRQMKVIYNAGIGGNTTSQLIARFNTDVLSKGSDWVHILIGRNDIMDTAEGGYGTVTTGITTLLDMCRDAGKRAVVGTIIPGNGRTVQQYSAEHRINAWIRNLPFTRPVVIADYASALARPDSNEPIVGSLHDTTHPGYAGAALMGRKLADTIRPFLAPTSALLNSELDAKNLLTRGRFSVGGVGAVPSSWFETGASGAARTYSKVERTDGTNGNWQRVVVPADASVVLASNVDIGTTLTIGDTVNFRIEYRATAAQVKLDGQYLFASIACYNGTSFTTEKFDCQYGVGAENWIRFDRSGVFRTGDLVIPSGTTLVQARIQLAGGVTLDLDRASVQKV